MLVDRDHEVYDVGVEVAALAWESATPLFARYSVPLSGEIDEAWLACYEEAVASVEFCRFRLDPRTRTVSFISKMSDGPTAVAAVLERLWLLVDFVNTRAPRESEPVREEIARGNAQPR